MNEIFNLFMDLMLVYIDDVLVFSNDIAQHWKHLNVFKSVVKRKGLVVSAKKMQLFQTKIRFMGFDITQGRYVPIDRALHSPTSFQTKSWIKKPTPKIYGKRQLYCKFLKRSRNRGSSSL